MSQAIHKPWIQNIKERRRGFLAIVLAVVIILMGIWKMYHILPNDFHTRQFKFLFKNYGSLARIALFFVLANYIFALIVQKRLANRWDILKKWMISLSRFTRAYHTPIAILAIGLIVLHVAGAFLYGFTFDFYYLSGFLALLVLLPVPISGLFRYRRMDRKWHLRFGLAFAVLFLIHAFL
ncbi:hypothetical protein [Effusibacillus dendaii]|nr:hypothetical protein [Effusibacillus dendaii]